MPTEDAKLIYVPCFFEFERPKEDEWYSTWIWLIVGVCSVALFEAGLASLNMSVNLFTAVYFVGGIGWVPATLCFLSHAYYKMCIRTYPYLRARWKVPFKTSELCDHNQVYIHSATLIFGFLSNKWQRVLAIIVWVFMFITVWMLGATYEPEDTISNIFIGLFYVIVGFVFTSVICAIVGFIISLFQLKRCYPVHHALFKGIVEQLRSNRHYWTVLNWCIVFLFALLVLAMMNSPYGTNLWRWLPVLGFFPVVLFYISHSSTSTLMHRALHQEEDRWNTLVYELIQSKELAPCSAEEKSGVHEPIQPSLHSKEREVKLAELQSILSIQGKYREYIQDKQSPTEWFLFSFTLMSAVGSILGALSTIMPDKISSLFFWL